MAKRTRRDLSDPRIKKIVKAQTGKNNPSSSKYQVQDAGPPTFRLFLIFTIIAIMVALGTYVFTRWDQLGPQLGFGDNTNNPPVTAANQPVQDTQNTSEDNNPPNETGNTTPANTGETGRDNSNSTTSNNESLARRIQVEVLNGCGENGLAEKITNYLRGHNVDVVSRGNYEHFNVPKTTVLDRVGKTERSDRLASLLGLSKNYVQVERDPNLQLDATIVIGKDYKQLKPFK